MKQSIEDAIEIGQLLDERHAQLPKGKYIAWIKANLPFSDRTARRYAQLYKSRDELTNLTSLSEAYKQLADTSVEMESELQSDLEAVDDTGPPDIGAQDAEPPKSGESKESAAPPTLADSDKGLYENTPMPRRSAADVASGFLPPQTVCACVKRYLGQLNDAEDKWEYIDSLSVLLEQLREKILPRGGEHETV